jgi:glycosyltransferase involved in cell wall biosynthesis
MHILQVHTRYRLVGGEDAVVEAERAALTRAGHHVSQHIATNPTRAPAAATALLTAAWNPLAARKLGATVDAVRPDVVHVHNTWFASSPSILPTLRQRRVPVVMTVHNYRLVCANGLFLRDGIPCEKCLHQGPWPAVLHGCYRGSRAASGLAAGVIAVHARHATWSRYVDKFIVPNEFAIDRLVRAGLPPGKLILGPHFVEEPGGRGARPSRSADVLFVGRIAQEKGVSVLLDAWRFRRPRGLRLLLIGDGPDRPRLEGDAPPGVTFLGQRPPAYVKSAMLGARAVVVPSLCYEMGPLTALQGLASGLPIVLSKIGGMPELLGCEAAAGWLVPPGDVLLLARALNALTDDAIVDDRGARARERYVNAYTASSAVSRLQGVYDEVCRSQRLGVRTPGSRGPVG